MSAEAVLEAGADVRRGEADDLLALSQVVGDNRRQLEFAVPDAYCAACISAIEAELTALPQVKSARVNLSDRRVKVVFSPDIGSPLDLPKAIRASGYRTHVLDPDADNNKDAVLTELIRSMAVAGFAAANIMLFSVSIWSGADAPTRNLFHWISALIALPAIAYAGRPFFRSAFAALRMGRTNMDVPITIGVLLASALSLYETMISGEHAYFDASTMLLFFLLIGRAFDHLMREKARGAIANLARLAPRGATRLSEDGSSAFIALADILPGMVLRLRPGDRVPVDCTVIGGNGSVDESLVTGESLPVEVGPGLTLMAGAMNLSGSITVAALRPSKDSFLSRMTELMESAEGARTAFRRIADRAASVYAPSVHVAAFLTFVGWIVASGNWHVALLNAVAVLIVTCPCALALAVPIVHAVAAGRLFENGIMMRNGAALERAASVTDVAFDKTGTLTEGAVRYTGQVFGAAAALPIAAGIAALSGHPLSVALAAADADATPFAGEITDVPGEGVEAIGKDGVWRLGSARFCFASHLPEAATEALQVCLARDGKPIAIFSFADNLRPDAAAAVAALKGLGLSVEILSGDRPEPVAAVAAALGVERFRSLLTPEQKLEALGAHAEDGQRVALVGDGINDAPALRAAHFSVAPSSASDIGRSAADFVFTNERLMSVPFLIGIARRADRLVRMNLTFAIAYNALALPLAVFGQVTPLIAALAMSTSSILVVANSLRLRLGPNLGQATNRTEAP